MTLTRRPLALLFIVLLQSCRRSPSPSAPAPAAPPPQTFRAETLTTRPVVEMLCSETKPGTEIAVVRVRPQVMPPDSARLDVTVFKDGFATQRYASVSVTRARLTSVQVHDAARQHARTALAFDTTHVAISNDSLVIRVENLEPGLNYFWRFVERVGTTMRYTLPTRVAAHMCHAEEGVR